MAAPVEASVEERAHGGQHAGRAGGDDGLFLLIIGAATAAEIAAVLFFWLAWS